MEAFHPFIQVSDKFNESTGITIGGRIAVLKRSIRNGDRKACIEKCQFSHPVCEHVIIERCGLKDGGIGDKVDPGAGHLRPELRKEGSSVLALDSTGSMHQC